MIVDCHTQIWEPSAQVCQVQLAPSWVTERVQADALRHLAAADPVDHSFVLGFKSRYLDTEIPNRYVSDYVRRHPEKMVGFAGIDPTDPQWPSELKIAQEDLRLKGVAVSPAMQNFHPSDTRALAVYDECGRRGMPIIFQQNHGNRASRMDYARPLLLDDVARDFPALRIVIAHMGNPWIDETIVLLGKHEHLYADISGLLNCTWTAYNALIKAFQAGVMDKLLFGSDFPFKSPAACIEALYSINQISHGTGLSAVPREQLRGVVERDALALLGIHSAARRTAKPAHSMISEDDER